MATKTNYVANIAKGAHVVIWSGVGTSAATDDGTSFQLSGGYQNVTVQVVGTFAGATLTMQGSNDGGNTWDTLHALYSGDLTFTAAGIKGMAEAPRAIRPLLSAGSGTDLDVYAVVRRPQA